MKSPMGNPQQPQHEVRGIYGLGGFLSISKELLVLPLVAKNLECMAGVTQEKNGGISPTKIVENRDIRYYNIWGYF